ncbi:unnamed protein product [Candida verbasci]|uniref:Octanoyltransferase n=1 Tax=Candida verbasci TaxID=1227364 RepID=A0A9W4TVD8_9ASCO|nr:unnamed protein product [Candida verbasci]
MVSYQTIKQNYNKTLQHFNYKGISSFQNGLNVQQQYMIENLAYKSLQSKFKSLSKKYPGQYINETELNSLELLKPSPKILTFEFDNVYAGGLKSKIELNDTEISKYKKFGGEYFQLNRGGQVTWHGQGQLTSYLLIDIKSFKNLTAKCFVSNVLLNSIIEVLKKYDIKATTDDENPGVWIDNDTKIASVGIRVRHGITEFGIALNINPNLKYSNQFEMCGLKDKSATSIYEINGKNPSVEEVGDLFTKEVAKALNIENIQKIDLEN